MGTTSSGAVDNVNEIGEVCECRICTCFFMSLLTYMNVR